MQRLYISESVLSAAAIISVVVGCNHFGTSLGAFKLKDLLDDIFDKNRCLRQRSSSHICVPSFDDIIGVLENRRMRFAMISLFNANIDFNKAFICLKNTYEIKFAATYNMQDYIGHSRDMESAIMLMRTKLSGFLQPLNLLSSSTSSIFSSSCTTTSSQSSSESSISSNTIFINPIVRPTSLLSILEEATANKDALDDVSNALVTLSNSATMKTISRCTPARRSQISTTRRWSVWRKCLWC